MTLREDVEQALRNTVFDDAEADRALDAVMAVVGGTDGSDQGDPAAWQVGDRVMEPHSWASADRDLAGTITSLLPAAPGRARVTWDDGDHSSPWLSDLVRAPGAVAAASPGDEAVLRVAPLTVKMLREHLCSAQTGTTGHVSAALGHLIAECDRHRPLGPDGKHGTRHTTTCGCEDTAPPAVIDPATWPVIEAHAGTVPPAPPAGHEDEAAVERAVDLRPFAWVVGDAGGGHIAWTAEAAEEGRAGGWTVIPLVRQADALAAARGPRTPDPTKENR